MLGAKCGEGAAPVLGEQEREVLTQRVLELRADRFVVVDDQQFRLVHGCRAVVIGSLTVNVVPTPSLLDPWMGPRLTSTIAFAGSGPMPQPPFLPERNGA